MLWECCEQRVQIWGFLNTKESTSKDVPALSDAAAKLRFEVGVQQFLCELPPVAPVRIICVSLSGT